jgi:hypothetical protein
MDTFLAGWCIGSLVLFCLVLWPALVMSGRGK